MQRFAISLRALPIALLAALLAMPTGVVAQTKKFVGLGRGLTVNDYALQCQHPVMKSEPDSRFAACIAYVVSAAEQAVVVNGNEACRKSVAERLFPGGIMESLYYLATQPDAKDLPLANATRLAVLAQHAACKIGTSSVQAQVEVPKAAADACSQMGEVAYWAATAHFSANDNARLINAEADARRPNKLRPAIPRESIDAARALGISSHGNAGHGNSDLHAARADGIGIAMLAYTLCLERRL